MSVNILVNKRNGTKIVFKYIFMLKAKQLFIIIYVNVSVKRVYSHNAKNNNLLTGTCFIQKIYAPSPSLLQGKHLPFTPSPLRLNIFRLFVILSLT